MATTKREAASAPQKAPPASSRFSGAILPDRSPKGVTREEALSILAKEVAPLPENLVSLLSLPERLYVSGDFFEFISISAQKARSGKEVAVALLTGSPFPGEAPDYAIFITHKGSSRFCVLVDKGRQVMAYAVLSKIMVEGSAWDGLIFRLQEALDAAKSYNSSNVTFNFVIRGEKHLDSVI